MFLYNSCSGLHHLSTRAGRGVSFSREENERTARTARADKPATNKGILESLSRARDTRDLRVIGGPFPPRLASPRLASPLCSEGKGACGRAAEPTTDTCRQTSFFSVLYKFSAKKETVVTSPRRRLHFDG